MKKRFDGLFSCDVALKAIPKADIAHLHWSADEAVAADADGLVDGGAASASAAVTLLPDDEKVMPCTRNITAYADGTAGSIKAVKITVYGENMNGDEISEELPAFTVDTAGGVTGSKAFAKFIKAVVPAMDGAGVTIDIGWGDKLGLPYKLDADTVLAAYLNNAKEATAPTVAVSASALESNTIDLNSDLAVDSPVDVFLIV